MTRGSVLLVDDEPKILKALHDALVEEGHETAFTSKPKEALRLLAARPFDVLVVDNLMPEMSGLELIREVLTASAGGDRPHSGCPWRGTEAPSSASTASWTARDSPEA